MTIKREWVTPITAGAFVLMAVTGILMFFDLDSALNKEAHEWFSWVFVAGAVLHVTSNLRSLKGHLGKLQGKGLVAVFLVVLGLSFIPTSESGETDGPPFMAPVQALAALPLSSLATVAHTTPDQLQQRLRDAGLTVVSDQQSVADLVGPDSHRQVDTVIRLFQPES